MAAKERISIIGTGLIGTSVGLAFKKANLEQVEVVGHDRNSGHAGMAKKMGAVDKTEWNLISAVERASLVVIATPVMEIRTIFEVIAPHLLDGCVVTDTASTKAQVMEWAAEILPGHVSFVGGHPMAGKETPGPSGAAADLFAGAVYCLTPSPTAQQSAVETVMGMVNLLGARPFFVDAAEHDGYAAGISHLPFLLSAALVSTVSRGPSWREMARVAYSGFRDASRLASGEPAVHRDICLTNRESILRWMDRYMEELQYYRRLVAEGGEALLAELTRAQAARDRWLARQGQDEEVTSMPEIPRPGEAMTRMFFGQRLLQASKRAEKKGEKGGR